MVTLLIEEQFKVSYHCDHVGKIPHWGCPCFVNSSRSAILELGWTQIAQLSVTAS